MTRTAILGIAILVSLTCVSRLPAAPPAAANSEWWLYGNSYEEQFYSPLQKINDTNVKRLGLAWYADIPSADGLVGNALVSDGVTYQSGALNRVYANDLRTGKLLWVFDPHYSYEGGSIATYWAARINRGLALWEDKVLIATGDCRMIAVDRKTGGKVWDVSSCDKTQMYGQTAAPHVGGGMVFTGNSCADSGMVRGFVTAFDIKTGQRKWRWYTVPDEPAKGYENKAMEMAAKTWGTDWWKKTRGCGQVWEAITYDPKLNLVYIGVAGVAPFNPAQRAPDAGDELFTNSIVALKADTGEYVWHYKLTPHDAWNLEPMQIMVADLPIGGKARRVVLEAPKNGFFYVLDAKTGEFISANNFAPVNWATHIDQKTGRPVMNPEARYWEKPQGANVWGGVQGLHNWNPMAYNPATGLVYIPVTVLAQHMQVDPNDVIGGTSWDPVYGDSDKKFKPEGRLVAWDPLAQKARWRVSQEMVVNGGVITTAGNLVFQGTAMGKLEARKADTGELLWSANTSGVVEAAPTTVEVDGEQFILVPSGNGASSGTGRMSPQLAACKDCLGPTRLLAYRLGGTAQLPKNEDPPPFPKPPRPPYPEELARQGHHVLAQQGCDVCHGRELVSVRGSVPDLRRASAATHDIFAKIVHDGVYKDAGMPKFADLSEKDLQALQAYVINQAWKAYKEQGLKNTTTAHRTAQ